jgi:chemotaxis protein CheX
MLPLGISNNKEAIVPQVSEVMRKLIFDSAVLVFRTMITEEITSAQDELHDVKFSVLSIISLAGEGGGVLSIACSQDTAVDLAAMLLGMSVSEINPETDMRDAIGEVANMVAGNLKTKLSSALPNLVLSIPTVITGQDYKVKYLAEGEKIFVPIKVKSSPLVFEYVFSKK